LRIPSKQLRFLRPPIRDFCQRYGGPIEYILIPGAALVGALAVFGTFVTLFAKAARFVFLHYQGAFGTWFSWQNTLTARRRSILTRSAQPLPATTRNVIIGGEGGLALIGALAATSTALVCSRQTAAHRAARHGLRRHDRWWTLDHACGGLRNTAASMKRFRVCSWSISRCDPQPSGRGLMRDPPALNKPSTREIGAPNMIGSIPGTTLHWGLSVRHRRRIRFLRLADLSHRVRLRRRVAGAIFAPPGIVGLNVGRLILTICFWRAQRPVWPGMGRSRRRARPHPTPISRQAMVLPASSSPSWRGKIRLRYSGCDPSGRNQRQRRRLLQRTARPPDASVLVLQEIIFVFVLASDALYGELASSRQNLRWRTERSELLVRPARGVRRRHPRLYAVSCSSAWGNASPNAADASISGSKVTLVDGRV